MLFQPLYCKLCSAQLSSTVVAKTHYTSKNHNKKVVKFLAEHSARTGEPLHKRSKVSSNKELEQVMYANIFLKRLIVLLYNENV